MSNSRGPLPPERRLGELAVPDAPEVPEAPAGLDPVLRSAWYDYWSSSIAQAADKVDLSMVVRLFQYRQQQREFMRRFSDLDDPMVAGSRNEDALRIHPYFAASQKLEATILKLEDRLGLNPSARARLGIELGQARLTWAELNRQGSTGGAALPGGVSAALPVGSVVED